MKQIITFFAILLMCAGSTIASPPDWFIKGQYENVTPKSHLIGVGSGDSYEKATENSLADIARQIETNISSKSELVISTYRQDDRELVQQRFNSQIKTTSAMTLRGATTVVKAADKKQYYVMSAIDREKLVSDLRMKLTAKRQQITSIELKSETLKAKGKIFEALNLLMDVDQVFAEMEPIAVMYSTVSGKPNYANEIKGGSNIVSEIREELGKIKLIEVSGDKQSGVRGKLLQESLVAQAFYTENSMPIAGAPFRLKDSDGKVVQRAYSDNEGFVKFWAYASGKERGNFTVDFDLYRLPEIFKKDLGKLKAEYRYNVTKFAPLTFKVSIFDDTGNELYVVEDAIKKSVTKAGHFISDQSNFELTGTMNVIESHKVDGLEGEQYLVSTEVELFLKSLVTGETVGSMTIKSKGMDENSERSAMKKAEKQLKVSEKDMEKMLSGAKDALQKLNERSSSEALAKGKAYFDMGKYQEALTELSQVIAGDDNLSSASDLISKIHIRFEKEAEKNRQMEIERLQAATAQAEAMARKAEAEAKISENKLVMEEIKQEIFFYPVQYVDATPVSVLNVDTGNLLATVLNQVAPLPLESQPLNESEGKLIGSWTYIGAIRMPDRSANFEGNGHILEISADRKIVTNTARGEWEASSDVLTINGLRIPYNLANGKLLIGLNLNGELWMLAYRR